MQNELTEVVIPEIVIPEVVIHDNEAVYKEENARTDFIIIDLVDLRAESNAQEVELVHQYITYNVYCAKIELRNEFRSATTYPTGSRSARISSGQGMHVKHLY